MKPSSASTLPELALMCVRPAIATVAVVAALLLGGCVGVANSPAPAAQARSAEPGPQGSEDGASGRELWLIPSQRQGLLMRAYLFRPPGDGPFRLAVINHGSQQRLQLRRAMAMPAFDHLTEWFLARGYVVVLPQRPGHGETGGPYLEDDGFCEAPNYARAGNATADSIAAAVDFMTRQPFIRPDGVVVVGHSAGGWGALALASRNPPAVAAVINLSGGRGGHDRNRPFRNCAPDRLVAVAGDYGRTARLPSLWLYASNDTYFPPDLSGRMAEAYKSAGGAVEYHLLSPVGEEGHGLAQASTDWAPYIEAFLKR